MVVWDRRPVVEYVHGPRSSLPPLIRTVTPPLIRTVTPPKAFLAPQPSPPQSPPKFPTPPAPSTPTTTRVELVSAVESSGSSTKASRASVTSSKKGRRSREEVYIDREIETVRADQPRKESKDLDVFQYMDPPTSSMRVSLDSGGRRSVTYEANPKPSPRTVERGKRVIIEDTGRRREYYRS